MNHLLDLPYKTLVKLEHFDINYQLELGEDHWLLFLRWEPSWTISENEARWGAHKELIKANLVAGANVIHKCRTETGYHEGAIHFRTPCTQLWTPAHANHTWEVHSWEPLTLSPSLLAHCPCSDHGFIREGRWVRA